MYGDSQHSTAAFSWRAEQPSVRRQCLPSNLLVVLSNLGEHVCGDSQPPPSADGLSNDTVRYQCPYCLLSLAQSRWTLAIWWLATSSFSWRTKQWYRQTSVSFCWNAEQLYRQGLVHDMLFILVYSIQGKIACIWRVNKSQLTGWRTILPGACLFFRMMLNIFQVTAQPIVANSTRAYALFHTILFPPKQLSNHFLCGYLTHLPLADGLRNHTSTRRQCIYRPIKSYRLSFRKHFPFDATQPSQIFQCLYIPF